MLGNVQGGGGRFDPTPSRARVKQTFENMDLKRLMTQTKFTNMGLNQLMTQTKAIDS